MELQLSRNDLSRTILSTGKGIPLYHINTPTWSSSRTTTISRIVPFAARRPEFCRGESSDIKAIAQSGLGIEKVAGIEWRDWKSSRILYKGKTLKANVFMSSGGFLWSKSTFVGPDGQTYTWHNGTHLTVSKPDNPKLEVARFHRPISFRRMPYLSIAREGLHIIDLIVVTWLFVASRERDRDTEPEVVI